MKEYNEQVVETLDDAGCIIANKNIIIDNLQARVRELEEENARLKAESRDACFGLNDYYGRKLAASQEENAHWQKATAENENKWIDACDQLAAEQLNNKLLRKALEAVIKVHGYESGIPVEAISTQASTEALDKYVAEKVKEAGKFDGWKTNPYTKVLETSIKQLTKQRDLAVEALKEMLEYAGIIEERCDSVATDKARAAIKESEAK